MHYEIKKVFYEQIDDAKRILGRLKEAKTVADLACCMRDIAENYKRFPTGVKNPEVRPLFQLHVQLFDLIAARLEEIKA